MKRVDLIRKIEEMGCSLIRHGGRHDWYQNPSTKAVQAGETYSQDTEGLRFEDTHS